MVMAQRLAGVVERVSKLALVAVIALALVAPPAVAVASTPEASAPAAADGSQAVEPWKIGLGKTFTYRIAASIDALVVGYLYTGSLLGGGGIALFNAVVSSTLYDLHELGWSNYGPDPQAVDPVQLGLWKTVSYRCISIANVLATGLFFTGNFWLSSGLALGNAVIDSTIYFFHELAWSYWGPPVQHDRPALAPAMAHKEG